MIQREIFDVALLNQNGLNLQAVFDIDQLPENFRQGLEHCVPGHGRRQLILIGHGGQRLWAAVQAAGMASTDPIDDFTIATVGRWFVTTYPGQNFDLLYPGDAAVGLQQLGQLAGWHHPSPFMVGIRPGWGSWFAYRAVLLADTDFAPTPPLAESSPCDCCVQRVCVESCPAQALADDGFDLARCVAYRKQSDSRCRSTCLARTSCPVGREHRYVDAQIRHTYSISMAAIEAFY